MKITPVAPGQGGMSTPGTSITLNTGRPSAVPLPSSSFDPSVEAQREAAKTRTIKMRVNQTPGVREYATPAADSTAAPAPTAEAVPAPEAPTAEAAPVTTEQPGGTPQPTPEVPVRSEGEQANATAEETKPLSPQHVALAKQRRALQVKERELEAREQALKNAPPKADVFEKARIQADPLSVLQEAGVTYDQLTEAILAGKEANPEVYKLKEELKALKEGIDKTLSDRDAQAEASALSDMSREAHRLIASGEDFELVRETKSVPKAMDLIKRTWKQDGEILPVSEALRLVEEELVSQSLRLAALKKVQGRLAPKAPAAPVTPAQPTTPQQPVMRTLTNRDTSTVPLSRKERAIEAFHGNKR